MFIFTLLGIFAAAYVFVGMVTTFIVYLKDPDFVTMYGDNRMYERFLLWCLMVALFPQVVYEMIRGKW